MITDPGAVVVLCFGDSHTHGIAFDDGQHVRLPADVRWTGQLQRLLGDGYSVIEEGLSGRTTDVDYDDRPGCNGRTYFVPCLLSLDPPMDMALIACSGSPSDEWSRVFWCAGPRCPGLPR